MKDTSPEMEKMHREMLMSLSGEERARMAAESFAAVQQIIWSTLPPEMPYTEKRIQLFLRLYQNDFSEFQQQQIIQRIREYDVQHPNAFDPFAD